MTQNLSLQSKRRRLWAGALPAIALGGGLLLSGCVVAPMGPAYAVNPAYAVENGVVIEASEAPPPLPTEMVPLAPSPVSVWIGGYWGWGQGRYVWNRGRWAAPPRPGYAWHPHRWVAAPQGRWHLQNGHWGPRR